MRHVHARLRLEDRAGGRMGVVILSRECPSRTGADQGGSAATLAATPDSVPPPVRLLDCRNSFAGEHFWRRHQVRRDGGTPCACSNHGMAFFHERTTGAGVTSRALRLLAGAAALVLTGAAVHFAASGLAPGDGDGLAACAPDGSAQAFARAGSQIELLRRKTQRFNSVFQYSARYRVPADLAALIYDVALSEGLDRDLGFRLVKAESGFDANAVSSAGAVGLAQLMPSTARALVPGITTRQLFHRETNLRVGFRLLRQLIDRYDGDLRLALVAYNGGHGKVLEFLRDGDAGVLVYVRRVMGDSRREPTSGGAPNR